MTQLRALCRTVRHDDRGEGPMGYIMLAAILGMLGLGLAPLMKDDTSKVFSTVMKGLLQGLLGLFGG